MLPAPNPAVIFQKLDDGAVLFSPETELYFGLNEAGVAIWELLPPANATVEELCRSLHARYADVDPAVLRADVDELLQQLLDERLVSAPGPAAPPDGALP